MKPILPLTWKTGQPRTTPTQVNSGNTHLLNTTPGPCSCLHRAKSPRVEKQSVHSCEDNSVDLSSPGGRRGGWAPFQIPESPGERNDDLVKCKHALGIVSCLMKITSLTQQEPGCILVGELEEIWPKTASPREGRVFREPDGPLTFPGQ